MADPATEPFGLNVGRSVFTDTGIGSSIRAGDVSPGQCLLMASFVGIAIWNSIEMVPLVFLTFTRYRTLYFWSLCVTVTGVLICSAAQIINIWVTNRSNLVPAALSCVGWIPMVTGQSLVLYSRLHLLYIELRTLRLVLIMIIFNAIVVHSAGFILTMGANSNSPDRYIYPYNIFEKVQVTIFFIQEIIISGLYLWKAKEFLGKYSSNLINSQDRSARTIREILTYLIVVNIIVVALDVTILVLEYLGLYLTQLTYKIFVYSVKVKCEVGILNRLIEFVKRSRRLDSNFQITRQMQREWEVTMEQTFARTTGGTSANAIATPSGDNNTEQCQTTLRRSPLTPNEQKSENQTDLKLRGDLSNDGAN